MIEIKGIFPPLPTSFNSDESLALDKMALNTGILMEYDLAGVVALGSNGELVMLSEKEIEEVLTTVRASVPAGRMVIAGTGAQSTAATVERCRIAAGCGADAALVLNPSYYMGQMVPDTLRRFYFDVADASPLPVIVYNMPANSGIDMDAGLILSIAEHPNVAGVKDSGGNMGKMGTIVNRAPEGFSVIAGSAGFLLPALSVGASGGILALANIAPALCAAIYRRFNEGDIQGARSLQLMAVEPNNTVTRKWGVPALKAAMDMYGFYGGPARRPLLPATGEMVKEIEKSTRKVAEWREQE